MKRRLAAVRASKPDCSSCPFALNGQPNSPVLGTFPKKPLGLIVVDAPGSREAELGVPVAGVQGHNLELELNAVKVGLGAFTVLSAVACRPTKKSDGNFGKAVKCCAPLFQRQIEAVDETLPALAMGKWAGTALTKKKRAIGKVRGFIRWDEISRPFVLTWSPTDAFIRNAWLWGETTVDIQRFVRICRGETKQELFDLNIHPTVKDVKALLASLPKLANTPWVSVDIETKPCNGAEPWTGKDPTRARLKSIALGTPSKGLALMHGESPQVWRAIKDVLRNPDVIKVWQNGWWFDNRVLLRYRMRTVNVLDTRDMRRAISPTSRLALGYLVSNYCDFHPWKENESDNEK